MSQYVRPAALQRRHYAYLQHAGVGAIPVVDEILQSLFGDVDTGLNDLVNKAKQKTQEIAQTYKSSLRTKLASLLPFFEGDKAVDEWAQNIVNYADSVRTTLKRVDASGKPFYARKPEAAKRILETARQDLNQLIFELNKAVKDQLPPGVIDSFVQIVAAIVDFLLDVLSRIAKIILKIAPAAFPLALLALGAAGLFVYFKFIRKKKISSSESIAQSTSQKVSAP